MTVFFLSIEQNLCSLSSVTTLSTQSGRAVTGPIQRCQSRPCATIIEGGDAVRTYVTICRRPPQKWPNWDTQQFMKKQFSDFFIFIIYFFCLTNFNFKFLGLDIFWQKNVDKILVFLRFRLNLRFVWIYVSEYYMKTEKKSLKKLFFDEFFSN